MTGDKRGILEVEEILQDFSKEEIMELTGIPISEMYSLPKFLWMHKNTDVLERAKYIFMYEDFIGYYLTGKRMISYSSASRTMAFDIKRKAWSKELLEMAGISEHQMSKLVDSGTVLGTILQDIARELGLPEHVKIAAGGHDQECAALGAGVISKGMGEDGHGTCEVMNIMLHEPLNSKYMLKNDLACIPGMIPGTYMTNIETTTCGILMNWSRDCIFEGINKTCMEKGINFFSYMDQAAREVKTDLLILPQFGSSGNPNINYDTKGLIWGLTVHTKPVEIYRAIKESMAFQMAMAYEHAKPAGIEMEKIAITGGGAVSDLTMQIRADVFGMEIISLKQKEAGTLGCMIVAAKAMGYFSDFEEGVKCTVQIEKTFTPDEKNKEYYQLKYERYKRLYQSMHDFI